MSNVHKTLLYSEISKRFRLAIILNLLYVCIEFAFAFYTGSMALFADAGHNFMDASSLFLSLLGFRLIKTKITKHNTFGHRKLSILLSLLNSILIIGSVLWIGIESIERISQPKPIDGLSVSLVALVGVFINFYTAFLFFQDKEKELNLKGAFVHMLADGLVSVGVIVSGVIIYHTNWIWIDPLISLVISLVILISIWGVLKESYRMSIDAIPKDIDLEEIKNIFLQSPEVLGIHDLHVWAISTLEYALIVHIKVHEQSSFLELMKLKRFFKQKLSRLKIYHSTIEFDFIL